MYTTPANGRAKFATSFRCLSSMAVEILPKMLFISNKIISTIFWNSSEQVLSRSYLFNHRQGKTSTLSKFGAILSSCVSCLQSASFWFHPTHFDCTNNKFKPILRVSKQKCDCKIHNTAFYNHLKYGYFKCQNIP